MGIDSGLGDSSTTPKQGKKILIVIAIVLVALIAGGLIFGWSQTKGIPSSFNSAISKPLK